ncbi:MAG: hypothetical protein CMF52_06470 [Legionellales bacterium]|nr:hypothetical protein [Legionellales bacterium]
MATPLPPGLGIDRAEWDTLSEASKKLFANLYNRVESQKNRFTTAPVGGKDFRDNLGGVTDEAARLTEKLKATQDAANELQGAFGSIAFEPSILEGISGAAQNLEILTGNAKAGAAAYKALSERFAFFNQISGANLKVTGTLTGQTETLTSQLAAQAATLEQLGLSVGSFAKNVDSAIFSFALNEKQVRSFNFAIKDMANSLKMAPEEVSRNFQLLTKNLAYDFTTIKDQFVKFQKLSLQTGISVGDLSSGFGARMDTIQGASSAAASINQLLGRNAFSATELLMMDDATRAEKIREAIITDPAIMGDIKSGSAAGKFALASVVEALPGFDRDTARRFLMTGDASVKDKIGEAVDRNVTGASAEKFKQLEMSTDDLVKAFKIASDEIIQRFDSDDARAFRARRERLLEGLAPGDITGADRARTLPELAGVLATFGPMRRGLSADLVARAMDRPDIVDPRTLERLVKATQDGSVDPRKLNELLTNALTAEGTMERGRAITEIANRGMLLGSEDSLVQELFKDLGPVARSGLLGIKDVNEFAYRTTLRALTEARMSNDTAALAKIKASLIKRGEEGNKQGAYALPKPDTGKKVRTNLKTFQSDLQETLQGTGITLDDINFDVTREDVGKRRRLREELTPIEDMNLSRIPLRVQNINNNNVSVNLVAEVNVDGEKRRIPAKILEQEIDNRVENSLGKIAGD